MRTLKYAILGLLSRCPMTGYDIGKDFRSQLAEFWNAKHSQIYPELKKLVDEQLIVYKIELCGDLMEKKVYTITDKGRREFLKWLRRDEPMEPTPKNVFRLRMYFSNNLSTETRLELLEHQLYQHQERLAFLEEQRARYPEVPPRDSKEFGDFIVLDSAIIREKGTITWLTNCIRYNRTE